MPFLRRHQGIDILADQLLCAVPQDLLDDRAYVGKASFDIRGKYDMADALHESPVFLLGFFYQEICLAPFGNIRKHTDKPAWLSRVVRDRRNTHFGTEG